MRNVAVVTGTRAEFGLLAPLMKKIRSSSSLNLQVIATGTHLLPEFGMTKNEITQMGFTIDWEVSEIMRALTPNDAARQVGFGIVGFTEAFQSLSPDVVTLLGDRYELLAAATAAFFLGVPIVHLHGGESTQGAFDDAIRHAISQFSSLHAVAADEYADRVIRAGAAPKDVYVVGGFGIDSIHHAKRLTRLELESDLGISMSEPLFLVTYHPVTSGPHDTLAETEALVHALESFPEATVVFTSPNADPEHHVIREVIQSNVRFNPNWHFFDSLGSEKYLSLVAEASVIVGNSSSGLMEAPALGVPTVNIGPRQAGRLMAGSVLCCDPNEAEIARSILRACSPDFQESFGDMENPYGKPGASSTVLNLLESADFDSLLQVKSTCGD